jgi:hypothetical protein
MRAGAEGAARLDDQRYRIGRSLSLLPRRPHPYGPDPNAVVERAPTVFPALRHVVDRHDVEAERRLVGVDTVGAVELLDALREDVQQESELRLAADDDVPLQRKALLSLPKSPPSALP